MPAGLLDKAIAGWVPGLRALCRGDFEDRPAATEEGPLQVRFTGPATSRRREGADESCFPPRTARDGKHVPMRQLARPPREKGCSILYPHARDVARAELNRIRAEWRPSSG